MQQAWLFSFNLLGTLQGEPGAKGGTLDVSVQKLFATDNAKKIAIQALRQAATELEQELSPIILPGLPGGRGLDS